MNMTGVWVPAALILAMAGSASQEAELRPYLSHPLRRVSEGKAPPPAELRAKLEAHVR